MFSVASFVRLSELIPSPDRPVGANGDWKRFTSVNGFPPPEDYRMLIREYGVGTFAGWIRLIEPFNHRVTFIELARAAARPLRGAALWPEPGGFLPWATTATGDLVGWRTTGRPDFWTTAFWAPGNGAPSEHAVGAIGFLLGLAEGSLGDPAMNGEWKNPFLLPGRSSFVPAAD